MNSRNKGIFCIILAGLFFATMGLFVRLAGNVPSLQKCFFRNMVALIIVLLTMAKNREKIRIKRGDGWFLFLRALFGTIGLIGNFYALDHLVLSDANMLNKLSPFFVIIFSFIILKEKITMQQGFAVMIAFCGALFIIKPTGSMSHLPAIAGAIGGIGAGAAYTMVRLLGKRGVNGNIVILAFSSFSCLVCIPSMILNFQPMTAIQVVYLFCAGIAAAGGQFSITRAYFYAPAKEISVYDYSQIIFAALLGFFVLGQIPDIWSVLGYVVICSMSVWMFLYNKRRDQIQREAVKASGK